MRVRCNIRRFATHLRLICCNIGANGIKLFNNNDKTEWGRTVAPNVQAGRFGAKVRVTKPPQSSRSLTPATTGG